jgi:hypothetical protein
MIITLHYITLHYVTLRYVTLRYVTLRYVTLRYVTLRYGTLHYITLHYIKHFIDIPIIGLFNDNLQSLTVMPTVTRVDCSTQLHSHLLCATE